MKIYRFSVGVNGSLVCIKADKTIEKFTGEKAFELLNHVKDFSFHTFNSILNDDLYNKGKKCFNMEFISNNHSVTFVNINRFQTKAKSVTIERELKDVMHIVKMNGIAKEREQLKQKRKILEALEKVRAIATSTLIGSALTYAAFNAPEEVNVPFKVEQVLEYDSSLISNTEINEVLVKNVNEVLNIDTISPEELIPKENINRANSKTYTRLYLAEIQKVKEYKEELERIKKEEEEKNKWDGQVLTSKLGVVYDTPSGGKETYYDADCISEYGMNGVVKIMRDAGYSEEEYPYYIREDGVRMFGDYVMVAANLNTYPRGTIVETTLGTAIVCDACENANEVYNQLDVAVNWTKRKWK